MPTWPKPQRAFFCLATCITLQLFWSSSLLAQQAPRYLPKKTVAQSEFAALVQYVKGKSDWFRTKRDDPIRYQTSLARGQGIFVEPKSYVKIKTSNLCTAVIYGPATLESANDASSWSVRGRFRWICPLGKTDSLTIKGQKIRINAAEVYGENDLLYVLSGLVNISGENLESSSVYQVTQNMKSLDVSSRKFSKAVRSLPVPKESAAGEFEPESETFFENQRWAANIFFGRPSLSLASEKYDVPDELHGLRLASQFRWGQGSLRLHLTWIELDGPSDNEEFAPFPPEFKRSARANAYKAGAGYRLWHDKWWSPYFDVSLGIGDLEVDSFNINDQGFSRYQNVLIGLGAGVEALLRAPFASWLGLLIAAEISYDASIASQSLDDDIENSLPPEEVRMTSERADPFSLLGFSVFVGPVLRF